MDKSATLSSHICDSVRALAAINFATSSEEARTSETSHKPPLPDSPLIFPRARETGSRVVASRWWQAIMAWAEFYRCSSSRRTPHKGPIRRLSEFHPRRNYIPAKVEHWTCVHVECGRGFSRGAAISPPRFSFSRKVGEERPFLKFISPSRSNRHAKFIRTPPTARR